MCRQFLDISFSKKNGQFTPSSPIHKVCGKLSEHLCRNRRRTPVADFALYQQKPQGNAQKPPPPPPPPPPPGGDHVLSPTWKCQKRRVCKKTDACVLFANVF